MERIFNVTANAARRIETLIAAEGQDGARMRVEVLGGGCSGFQYQFKFDDSTADDDHIFAAHLGGVNERLIIFSMKRTAQ